MESSISRSYQVINHPDGSVDFVFEVKKPRGCVQGLLFLVGMYVCVGGFSVMKGSSGLEYFLGLSMALGGGFIVLFLLFRVEVIEETVKLTKEGFYFTDTSSKKQQIAYKDVNQLIASKVSLFSDIEHENQAVRLVMKVLGQTLVVSGIIKRAQAEQLIIDMKDIMLKHEMNRKRSY